MLNLLKQERIDAAGGKHLLVSCVIRGNTRWRPSSADKCTHIVTVSLFFVLRWVCLSALPRGATENPALLHLVWGKSIPRPIKGTRDVAATAKYLTAPWVGWNCDVQHPSKTNGHTLTPPKGGGRGEGRDKQVGGHPREQRSRRDTVGHGARR